jgi:hypothetical protein
MMTLLEALAQLTEEKSILGWRPREVIATTRGSRSFVSVKWDFPDDYYSYILKSYQEDDDDVFRPDGVSDRDWLGPPPDKVMIVTPTEGDIFCAGLLLGANEEKDGGKIVFRPCQRQN